MQIGIDESSGLCCVFAQNAQMFSSSTRGSNRYLQRFQDCNVCLVWFLRSFSIHSLVFAIVSALQCVLSSVFAQVFNSHLRCESVFATVSSL